MNEDRLDTSHVTITYRDGDGEIGMIKIDHPDALEQARSLCKRLAAGDNPVPSIKATCFTESGRDVDVTVAMGVQP